jgi:hypothetical protein
LWIEPSLYHLCCGANGTCLYTWLEDASLVSDFTVFLWMHVVDEGHVLQGHHSRSYDHHSLQGLGTHTCGIVTELSCKCYEI